MVQIHSPRPLLLKPTTYSEEKCRRHPGCVPSSVVPMSSPNDLHFPLQIGVKWRDAATTFSLFCSPRSPNRTGFDMGRLKPRPLALSRSYHTLLAINDHQLNSP